MLQRFRQSLITRLMLYFVLVALVVMILFAISFARNLRVHFKQEVLPNIAQYLVYVARDIGSPPDLSKAQQLSESLSFELSIRGPDVDWHSHAQIPALQQLQLETAPAPYQAFRVAHYRGHNYAQLEQGEYLYLFVIGRPFDAGRSPRGLWLLLVILSSLIILFLLIRSSLKPLKAIDNSIKRIAVGDLDSVLEPGGSGEFKRLAEGINDMTAQIRSMLESKQQLLLAVSHELRSPITRARVNLELLPEHPSQQAIREDLQEMEALISQILESERLNQKHSVLNRSDFAMDELVNDILSQYFSQQKIDTRLTSQMIHGDRTRLGLLVKNLLDNALKYSADSNKPPQIRLSATASDIVLEVEDHGSGLTEREIQHITEPFYRLDPSRQRSSGGFGLGLYLSRRIVEAHQGRMTFHSQPGQGTRVHVEIPLNAPRQTGSTQDTPV